MKKLFWYPLAMVCICMLAAISFVRNIPASVYNFFHARKKKYWHPVDWLTKEDYDVTESYYHD